MCQPSALGQCRSSWIAAQGRNEGETNGTVGGRGAASSVFKVPDVAFVRAKSAGAWADVSTVHPTRMTIIGMKKRCGRFVRADKRAACRPKSGRNSKRCDGPRQIDSWSAFYATWSEKLTHVATVSLMNVLLERVGRLSLHASQTSHTARLVKVPRITVDPPDLADSRPETLAEKFSSRSLGVLLCLYGLRFGSLAIST